MARFNEELPHDLIKQFEGLEEDCHKMFGEMVKAGAEKVHSNIIKNVPESFKDSDIMKCLKMTKVYVTPSDDGVNCFVGFYGYFLNNKNAKNKDGTPKKRYKIPAPLVVNVFEYGKSNFEKQPFFRKSFNKRTIENVMKKIQDKYIKDE